MVYLADGGQPRDCVTPLLNQHLGCANADAASEVGLAGTSGGCDVVDGTGVACASGVVVDPARDRSGVGWTRVCATCLDQYSIKRSK